MHQPPFGPSAEGVKLRASERGISTHGSCEDAPQRPAAGTQGLRQPLNDVYERCNRCVNSGYDADGSTPQRGTWRSRAWLARSRVPKAFRRGQRVIDANRSENIPHSRAHRLRLKSATMMRTMTSRHTSSLVTLLALGSSLLVVACGDDESSSTPPPTEDAGVDASASSTAPESTAVSSQSLETGEAPLADCTTIATSCEGKDDVDGLGNLCLRVAASNNAEECASVVTECEAFCDDGQVPALDGGEVSEELCKAMGNTCHDFDEGSGLGHLCHEVGHMGNVAWCGAIFDECVALCGQPDVHHGDDDASDASALQSVTIEFAAKVGESAFACGQEYAGFGSANSVVTPQDLRLFVSGIRLITKTGEQVPAVIDDVAPFQGSGVALLDFEDATGECRNGNAVTNTSIEVLVPRGDYTGIAFSTSVPAALNHEDALSATPPLQPGDMTWGWLLGYKFIKAEFVQVLPMVDAATDETTELDAGSPGVADAGRPMMNMDAMAPMMAGVGIFHLGSTDCTNSYGPDAGANEFDVTCAKPAFNDVVLADFKAGENVVTFDLAQVFADTDLSTMSMCHGMGASCPSLFASVGVDFATGAALTAQSAFGVE